MSSASTSGPPAVRGLFVPRVPGDDALLRLAALRFEQAGMPAELYADDAGEARRLLGFVPAHATHPTVHLGRRVDLLAESGRATVLDFVELGERVAGLVVHDQREMLTRVPELIDALRVVGDRRSGPVVYLEYAAGAPLDWFVDVARRAATIGRAGVCVDIGHVGLVEVHRLLATTLPGPLDLGAHGPALADVVEQVQAATRGALPTVLGLIDELGALGSNMHLHLHDGHPSIPRLSDHRSFLTSVPVPFRFAGARSLAPMFGPGGLAAILSRAVAAVAPERLSLTLEIHQAEGRLPLEPEAGVLFSHWRDRTNAERSNYLLAVIAANHLLATTALARSWE